MALLTNDAEGQSSGTTLTAANSGGGSGNAFNTVTQTGTGSITFSNSQAAHGSQSYAITASAGAAEWVDWSGGTAKTAAARAYIYINSTPAAGGDIFEFRNSTTVAAKVQIQLSSGNMFFAVTNSAGTGIHNFTAGNVVTGTWYRIEMQATAGTTTSNGTINVQYYALDSYTAIETYSSGAAVNAGTTNITDFRMGQITTTSATLSCFIDDIAANLGSATPIGPVNIPPTVSLNTPSNGSTGVSTTPTLAFTGTDNDGNAIAYWAEVDTVNTFNSQTTSPNVSVAVWSGGGGGGGSATGTADGAGGGGGAFSGGVVAVSNGTGYMISIGAAGTAGTGSGADGGTGGDSFFNTSGTIFAKGGGGGQNGTNGTTPGAGGAAASGIGSATHSGGVGGTGASNHNGAGGGGSAGGGSDGGAGTNDATGTAGGAGGTAGSYLPGAVGGTGGNPGGVGGTPGGGGGGGKNSNKAGGAGGPGQVTIFAPIGTVTSATGGVHTTDGVNDYWTFNTSGTWTPNTTGPLISAFSSLNVGFADITTPVNTSPFPSGDQIGYTVQTTLTAGTTYYWRLSGIDPAGSNTFGAWSSIFDFTVLTGSGPSVSDTTTTSENISVSLPVTISVSDTTTTSENITPSIGSFINVNDTTTTSESISVLPIGIYFDASSNSGYKASLSTYSWSHTTTGINRGLVVNVSLFLTGSVTSITYNGVNLQFIRFDSIGVYRNELWVLGNPTIGTNTITVTLNTSLTSIASADSYTGVDTAEMVEANIGATGSGVTSPTLNLTTVSDQAWIVDGLTTSDTTMSVTGSQTQRNNQTGALGTGAMGDLGPVTPVGTKTMSWSTTGALDSWALSAIGLDPANEAFTAGVTVSDGTTTSENVMVSISEAIVVSDLTSTTESIKLLISTLFIGISDSTVTSEIVNRTVVDLISIADTTATSENITLAITDIINVSDSTITSEFINLTKVSLINVSDITTTSEIVTPLITTLFIRISDSIATSESINISSGGTPIVVSDLTTVTEHVSISVLTTVNVSDSTAISELINIFITALFINVFDTTTTNESVTRLLTNLISVSDSTTTSENVIVSVSGTKSISVSDLTLTSENVRILIPTLSIKTLDTIVTSEQIFINVFRVQVLDTTITSELVTISSYLPNPTGRVTSIPFNLPVAIVIPVVEPAAIQILFAEPTAIAIPFSLSPAIQIPMPLKTAIIIPLVEPPAIVVNLPMVVR